MNEKYQYDWSLSSVGDDKYKYEYVYHDEDKNEYKVSWTKEWSAWDYSSPMKVSFEVKILSGELAGQVREYYFYSDARKERDMFLASGVCAVMRYVK